MPSQTHLTLRWIGTWGAQLACLGSLLNTCKLNDIDPLTWLTDVLERIVSGRTKNHQLHELLPWIWKAARATPSLEVAA